MVRTGNYTAEWIHNDTERIAWTFYNIIILLSSLLGDTVILVATIKYKAITLNRVIIVIIQHLAVSDLLLSVFRILPSVISLLAQGWVFGRFLCLLQTNVTWLCFCVTGGLTMCLAAFKFLSVKYPFQSITWNGQFGHVVCAIVWAVSLLTPYRVIHIFFTATDSIHFSYFYYSCDYDMTLTHAPIWLNWVALIHMITCVVVSYAILILSSTFLLLEARKTAKRHGQRLRWKGLLTVPLIVLVYVSSTAFWLFAEVTKHVIHFSPAVWRSISFLMNLNIMANFFIYSLTVTSFRKFLVIKFLTFISPSPPLRRQIRNHVTADRMACTRL